MRQIVHCLVKTDIFPRFFNFSTLCKQVLHIFTILCFWPIHYHISCSLSRKGHRVVNGNFLSQQWKRYLGEVRINRNDKIAVFPCETFVYENTNHNNNNNEKVQQFCFHYVARSILGTTNTTFVFCMPASDQGKYVAVMMDG